MVDDKALIEAIEDAQWDIMIEHGGGAGDSLYKAVERLESLTQPKSVKCHSKVSDPVLLFGGEVKDDWSNYHENTHGVTAYYESGTWQLCHIAGEVLNPTHYLPLVKVDVSSFGGKG